MTIEPESSSLAILCDFLSRLAPGLVQNESCEVLRLLADAWGSLTGHDEAGMAAWKIERAENLQWQPPVLSFSIEGHGGAAFGSTRAEMQRWTVDIDSGDASCTSTGYRQIRKTDKRLDTGALAVEIDG